MLKQLRFSAVASIVTFICMPGSTMVDGSPTVAGKVIAADGSAVPSASVEAVRLPGENDDISATQLRWIQVDHDARFRLTLPPGRYEIRVKDEVDGYPDPNFLLSTDPHSEFPVISVDGQDLSEVKVKLGTKGGILEGELIDKATRSPVENGKITIADARRAEVFVEVFADKGGHFQFAVPNKALQISGSAPKHRVATFEESVTLAGGERRRITLELLPAK